MPVVSRLTDKAATIIAGTQEHAAGSSAARQFWAGPLHAFAAADALDRFYATRAALTAALLRGMAEKRRVLEVGCGSGRLAALLAQDGHQVTALDLSPSQLIRARERCAGHPVDLRLGGLEVLDAGERFDAVFAVGVLPYIADQPRYLEALRNHVTNGGLLCVSITRAASIFTLVELARHLARFNLSASWWWVAANLLRTGIWSGGFILPHERIDVAGRHRLDQIMQRAGFNPVDHFALFNITKLDLALSRRGAIARRLADRLGWCIVAAYERRS
jgi:2-polyprenyl-3-methyl-5-hydroxy-6-metoxy-1,4-benzoquinol methylase